ncbi:MAG: DUF2281 domain-containing protein [Magnetococcales bacterium]|nr:DUF2281 domain-containing protein [Magnetococcales bacterium]
MNLAEEIQQELRRLPEPLAREVLDFIGYLEFRHGLTKSTTTGNLWQDGASSVAETLAAFRGSGKGGTTKRLLIDRQQDREQEA